MKPPAHSLPRLVAIPALLSFFGMGLAQMTTTSPTFDEGFALLRGYAAWRTGHLLPIGHPPLAHWLTALGVSLEPGLPDPRTLAGWEQDQYDQASRDLLWQRGLPADRLTFLGRYPILLLGVVLGALTARWARELFGWPGAGVALALHAFSPNLLANAALATTDVPLAFTFTLTLYAWQRYVRGPRWRSALALGAALGLALASKFSSLALFPILGVLAGADLAQHRSLARLRPLLAAPAAAGCALWAVYGFDLAPYPLAAYWRELGVFLNFAQTPQTAYLFGRLSPTGFPGYYLVVLAVKTPLTVLLLAGLALARGRALLLLLAPIGLFLAATFFASLNLGYRYLLPILPALHLVAAGAAVWAPIAVRRWLTPALLAFNLISTLSVAPAFIPYFNELVGAANGYLVLSDSNVDWGQDLPALARYLAGRPVYLAYFGLADPGYYGIDWRPLPAWPPPLTTDFVPADPAPGLYAISASNLVGVQLLEVDAFSYFKARPPLAVINHSIFVFEVPDRAPAATLVECAPAGLDEAAIAAFLNGRAVRRVSADCAASYLQPPGPALVLAADGAQLWRDLGEPVYQAGGYQGSARFRVYRSEPEPEDAPPLAEGEYLSLIGYQLEGNTLILRWRVEAPVMPPVSVFVHLDKPDGSLGAAYDALGVPAEYWQAGDEIGQRYLLEPAPPAGEYQLVVGLYALDDSRRRYSSIPLTTVRVR